MLDLVHITRLSRISTLCLIILVLTAPLMGTIYIEKLEINEETQETTTIDNVDLYLEDNLSLMPIPNANVLLGDRNRTNDQFDRSHMQ